MSHQKNLRRRLTTAARQIRAFIKIQELVIAQPENADIVHLAKSKITDLQTELSAIEAQLERVE